MNAACFTVRELAERGRDNLPPELQSGCHLIYSSPATLAFNSPGAEGFGVKRAGLAIPPRAAADGIPPSSAGCRNMTTGSSIS